MPLVGFEPAISPRSRPRDHWDRQLKRQIIKTRKFSKTYAIDVNDTSKHSRYYD